MHDQTGKRLTIRGGEVVDGPFVETNEAIGGVFVIQAESLDAATAIARDCLAYADLHASLGNLHDARAYLDRALSQQSSRSERALLERERAWFTGRRWRQPPPPPPAGPERFTKNNATPRLGGCRVRLPKSSSEQRSQLQ